MSDDKPKDEPTDNSEQQADEQATDSDQAAGQAEEQSADSDQPSEQSEEQPADSDQASEQAREQVADSDQPSRSGSMDDTDAFAEGDASSGGESGSSTTNVSVSTKSAGTAMSPFPAAPFPDLVRDAGKLKDAFTAAKSEAKADPSLMGGLVDVDGKPLDVEKIPMAIASLNLDGTTSVIGQHDVTEMFFS